MRKMLLSAAAASVFAFGTPAGAAVTLVETACVSVADSAGCRFQGNINPLTTPETESDYNAVRDPNISLNFITRSDDGNFGVFGTLTVLDENDDNEPISGTWSLPGWIVDFIAVKAGNHFVLYQVTPGSSGSWDTFDLPTNGRNPIGLSGVAFFGNAIPEPATWAMMIGGFGLVGAAMRRKRSARTALA